MLKESKKYFPTRLALLIFVFIVSAAAFALLAMLIEKQTGALKPLIYAVKIIFALSVISSKLSSEAKCSWVFLILALPYAAIPAYLLFCRTRLTRKEKEILTAVAEKKPMTDTFDSRMRLKCNGDFTFLREMANFSNTTIYNDTSAKYIDNAKKMIDMLKEDIRRARRFVFLEFYTVAAGEVFGEICSLLIEKAAEGVEVRIIYDEIGSLARLPEEFPALMKKKGIKAVAHASLTGIFPSGLNNRNHRKIAVIDGEIAYTGGINLADEYVYSRARLGKWKDSAVRIEGEGVAALTYTFLSDFSFIRELEENFTKYYKYRKKRCEGQTLIFDDGPNPLYREKSAEKIILSLLAVAEKDFTVTTPYLVCNSEVLSAIRGAVRRGVRVRIVIPSRSDGFLIGILTRHNAARLSEVGAQIYVYTPGFLHSKTYLCDGKYLMCGTVNLDFRSLNHNFENGVLFAYHSVIPEAERDIEQILSECLPYENKREMLPMRIFGAIMEIFSPLF